MKTGDLVKLYDGSYNMSLIKGELEHITGIYHHHRCYRVLGTSGDYPVTGQGYVTGEVNNTMLVDVNDTDFILFTQEQFCSVVTPVPPQANLAKYKVSIPHGTKEVQLILQ